MGRLMGGRYEIGEEIGRGGMARVHRGYDNRLGRPVAIKVLHSTRVGDRTFQSRFRREATAAASLTHPNIVAVFDSGEDIVTAGLDHQESIPYIVMELIEGDTLSQRLHDNGPFEMHTAAKIAACVLSALEYSHEHGVVHRDIKPGNVMITDDGDVKVMDFGIARGGAGDSTATMTQTQAVVGTAQYLSPEQARGLEVDGRSDIYSTGCLLFELVTGRPPFVGDSPLAIAYQHVGEDPSTPSTFNPDVPADLDAVVLHALIKDRERRYQRAEDMADDLTALVDGREISAAARGTAAAAFAPTETLPVRGGVTASGAAAGAAGLVGAGVGGPGASGGVASGGAADGGAAGRGGAGGASGGPSAGATAGGSGAAGAVAAGGDAGRSGGGGSTGSRGTTTLEDGPGRDGHHTSSLPPVGERARGSRWFRGFVVLAMLVLLGLVGWGTYKLTLPPPQSTVPQLVGMNEATARAALDSAHLQGDFHSQNNDKPAGTVFGQFPQAGTLQDRDTSVTVQVSLGPTSVKVPQLARFSLLTAQGKLRSGSLVPGDVLNVDTTDVPKGNVVRTDPAAGTTVDVNTRVNLYVSTGKVKVPDLTGQQSRDVQDQLTALGLVPEVTYVYSSQPRGTVLSMDPVNVAVDPGSKVTLTVVARRPTPTATSTTPPSTTTPQSPNTSSPSPSTPAPSAPPTTPAPAPSTPAPVAPSTPAPATPAGP
ncbi:protein kinase domain-containing protein [Arsenicicoccus piscis]|uniref:non-specific serine/threonine protein kinase n=2 Tax=Arsenicicoccus piscis TaxID=673954 RepID=A0ABQ6HT45_9MICO|nr:PASTA domain-containing protein [Arsenicicoccus piscis]GMA21552.1 hypothetical protein GCM10025862_35730 [Arsenicicoccus piscis]